MTLYKTGQARFAKWRAKYDPATVSARFTQVASVAADRAQEGLTLFASVDDLVRPVLDKYGVTGTDRAKYLGFAKKLLKHIGRAKGDAAIAMAQGIKAFYVTGMKADPAICDEIVQVIVGWMAAY
jgi:hypothetical protein